MSVYFHIHLIFGNKFWKFSNIWKDWVKISGSIIGKKRQKTKTRQKLEKQKKARKLFAAKFSYAAKLIS